MKLALIRRQFAATGGAELYLQRLLRALVTQGHEPHLFAESWDDALDGVKFHRVPTGGSRATRPVRFAETVRETIEKEKFDCVFSLERALRQDVYRAGDGVHRVWLQRRREFAPVWKRPFVGRGAFHRNMLQLEAGTFDSRNTRHIIVNSEMVRREIREHFAFPDERIHLVRNGVDVARFQRVARDEARKRFDLKDTDFVLLFVGSGWERKGLRYLFDALRSIDRQTRALGLAEGMLRLMAVSRDVSATLKATLTGVAPDRPAHPPPSPPAVPDTLKLLVVGKGRKPANTPPNVIFAGPMADTELAYAAADLFVFLPIYEPAANVVVEALAAGL
ncbi:MAG TPA: glycosyltransferase family 4 protein, partial [Verrucomicrobiae bacterium]|nr:glycosyltransferase family 4 protein [Verrucomicrobiae bacterium]